MTNPRPKQPRTFKFPTFGYKWMAILTMCGTPALYGQQASPVSITPNVGAGAAQTFKLVYSDPLGAADIKSLQVLFTGGAAQTCYVVLDFSGKTIRLNSDSGGWVTTPTSTPSTIFSSMCSINGPGVAVATSGNNLTLTLPLTLKPAFAGLKQVWMSAAGAVARSGGLQELGTWTVPGAAAAVAETISVAPVTASLTQGLSQQFAATVTGAANAAVTWSISPQVGSISAAGLYTAPANVASQQIVTVTATSVADPTKAAPAAVTLAGPVVTVSASPAAVTLTVAAPTQQFAATVTGSANIGITWSISPQVGSISPTGLYTAPANIAAQQTVIVTATSNVDRTKAATDTITLSPGVTISAVPAAVTLTAPSSTQQFTATVTGSANIGVNWSISPQVGSISPTGLYTAPAGIAAQQTVTVTATSNVDHTKTAIDIITLSAGVTISAVPAAVTLTATAPTQQFTATVTGSANIGITWSISPQVGSISPTGLYTVPASITAQQTVTVTATSNVDHTKTAKETITLSPAIAVSAAPATVILTPTSAPQQFTATVTGSANLAVVWSLSPQVGSISAAGLYTAPAAIASQQTVTVTATSVADPTKAAKVTITLSPSAQTLGTFQLNEFFGVSWPDQPIEFRYDGGQPPPATARMIGPTGAEVPYQWVTSCSDTTAVKGCIVVRGSLPAGANYTWTLQSGTPQAAPVHPVQAVQAGSNWEITNGLTGVRVVTATANGSPWNRAPIQGILLPGGTWTGAGAAPNFLYSETNKDGFAGNVGAAHTTAVYSATGYQVTVTDSGPMKVVIKATYTFNRPQYSVGSTIINTAGAGHYTIIFTMYANSKSIVVDEDSDMLFSYYVPLYAQLMPDISRNRGHDSLYSGVPNSICGYDASLPISAATKASPIVVSTSGSLVNGQSVLISGMLGNTAGNGSFFAKTSGYGAGQFGLYTDAGLTQPVAGNGAYTGGGVAKPAYQGQTITPTADGYLDLTYSTDRPASYLCSPTTYRKLMTDYPAATHGAGWYSELYNSKAGAAGAVVGIYTGRASQQLYSATGPSMPGIYTSNQHWITGKIDGGIQVDNLLRGPDGSTNPMVHRNWAIWVSTQADLLQPAAHQPIGDEQNALTGINLSRLYTYQLVYPDPPGGFTWQYLSTASANTLISQVRNGTSVCGSVNCYYNLLNSSETSPWGRALLTMWKGNSSAAVQTALNTGVQLGQKITQTLANGDNHFDNQLGYYQLGLSTSPETAVLNAVIMDSNTTPAQRATAKAALALFGCILWDNDWFPIDNQTGESVGLSNQIQQYLQYRAQSAAADPSQPFLATKVSEGLAYPTNDFSQYFSSTGAAAGSTHYQSAFFEPLILNYLNFSMSGALSMTDPKWAAYANWELSIQTPPEPRFGNVRKGYSNGDGNTEADVRTGMLATALYPTNPALAGNLMWAWQQSNSATMLTEDAQFVTTLATIDPTIPAIAPALGSINVPGYHSAERQSFGTPFETALWFINGGFYSSGGHRHADDGQVSIYADSAPLAIDWNANLYNPSTPGRLMHNSIVMDAELTHPWSADSPSLTDADTLLGSPTNTEYAAFANSTTSTATFNETDGTVWTRTARTMAFNPAYPIIYVHDSFAGPGTAAGKTLTWNLMAAGPVATAAGSVNPTVRFSPGCEGVPAQFPSNGAVHALANGLAEFSFTGVKWPKHATGGINWDLFEVPSSGSAQFLIGNWGHGCHPTRESGEFQAANGTPFSESQHILRVHDTGPFTTVILPYRKTETPVRTVTQQLCGTQIVQGAATSCFNNSAATYTDGIKSIVTVYDNSIELALGLTLAGGPQEVTQQPGQVVWTISGAESGIRILTLPGNWTADTNVPHIGPIYTYNYLGGLQTAPVTVTFKQ